MAGAPVVVPLSAAERRAHERQCYTCSASNGPVRTRKVGKREFARLTRRLERSRLVWLRQQQGPELGH